MTIKEARRANKETKWYGFNKKVDEAITEVYATGTAYVFGPVSKDIIGYLFGGYEEKISKHLEFILDEGIDYKFEYIDSDYFNEVEFRIKLTAEI